MRILIVSQYFWPETFIINDLAAELQASGQSVTVATGKPNYPSGVLAAGYTEAGLEEETFRDAIRVIRVPMRARREGGVRNLLRNYLSFVVSASWHLPRRLKGEQFDAILVFAVSPITAAIPAILLKRLFRAHLAIWVQDLWPDSLMATGFVKNQHILRLVAGMVRLIYRGADTLLVQSAAFIEPVARYADRSKIVYFPNFAPAWPDCESPLSPKIETLISTAFTVVFAGNLGRAQDLGTILDAADRLQDDAPDAQILIAGSGSQEAWLGAEIARRQLRNVHPIGWVDGKAIPALFRRADALLVTLGSTAALEATIPSKIPAYMQAGKPIVAALNGEGARLIQEAEAGLVVRSGDGPGLADSILTLMRMSPNRRDTLGENARRTYLEQFEAGQAARKLSGILSMRSQTKG